jgi:hypothetical protein
MKKVVSDLKTNEAILSIRIKDDVKTWAVQNKNVIQVLQKRPLETMPEYLENCILVGDIVINYASIQTSEECIKRYFGGISDDMKVKVEELGELKKTVEKEITENLPIIVKEKIQLEIQNKVTELQVQVDDLKRVKAELPATLKAELLVYVDSLKAVKDQLPDTIKSQLQTHIDSLILLKDQLPDTITSNLGSHIKDLDSSVANLKNSSNIISDYLMKYKTSAAKGKMGENYVFDILVKNFKEDEFEPVSHTAVYSDIQVKSTQDIVGMLIEVKNYDGSVPSTEVKKFWRDLDFHKTRVGCFISLGASIDGGIGDYKIVTKGEKIGVFMNVGAFGKENSYENGINFTYFITRKFAQNLACMDRESVEESQMKRRIEQVLSKINDLKSNLEKLAKIRDDLSKIVTLSTKSMNDINSLYTSAMAEVNVILTPPIEKAE